MSVHDDHNSVLPHLPEAHLVVLSSCDVYRVYELFLHGEETPVPVPVDEDGPLRAGRYPYRGKGMDLEDYDKLDIEPAYLRRGGTVLRLGLPGSRGGRGSHLQDQDVAAHIRTWPDRAAQGLRVGRAPQEHPRSTVGQRGSAPDPRFRRDAC